MVIRADSRIHACAASLLITQVSWETISTHCGCLYNAGWLASKSGVRMDCTWLASNLVITTVTVLKSQTRRTDFLFPQIPRKVCSVSSDSEARQQCWQSSSLFSVTNNWLSRLSPLKSVTTHQLTQSCHIPNCQMCTCRLPGSGTGSQRTYLITHAVGVWYTAAIVHCAYIAFLANLERDLKFIRIIYRPKSLKNTNCPCIRQ